MIHLDAARRDEAIEAAYLSAVDRLGGLSLAQFSDEVADLGVYAVVVGGEMAGAVIAKGPELHACIRAQFKGRWMTRGVLRFLAGVVREYGYAATQATTEEGRHFVERLGFKFNGKEYVLR